MAEFNLKEVPPWGWAIALGVGGYIYFTKKNSAPATDTTATDTSGANLGNNAPLEFLSADGSSTSTVQQYQTNQQWATAAINWLIAQGYDAALANSAITKGLAGGQDMSGNGMSASEYSLWSLALQHLGSPPEPVSVSPPTQSSPPVSGGSGGSGTPPPVKPPPPKTKNIRYVTVQPWPKKNSSLWSIAQTYYHDGNKWPEIFNANRKGRTRADGTPGVISNANLIYPGEKLIVP